MAFALCTGMGRREGTAKRRSPARAVHMAAPRQQAPMTDIIPPVSVERRRLGLSWWDLAAILLVAGLLVVLAEGSRGVVKTLAELQATPLSLDPSNLPEYAARTTLRM